MHEAGRRAFAARTPERTGIYSFERRERAKLSKEQDRRLRRHRGAAAFFDAQPPGYRSAAIHWIITARRPETQDRRLAQVIADSAAGRRIEPLTRPGKKKSRPAKVRGERPSSGRTARDDPRRARGR